MRHPLTMVKETSLDLVSRSLQQRVQKTTIIVAKSEPILNLTSFRVHPHRNTVNRFLTPTVVTPTFHQVSL